MAKISIDFETRSAVDLKDVGLDVYAKDPSTEVICMAYALEGQDVQLWTPDQPFPVFVDPEFWAWNAGFEYNIMKHVLKHDVDLSRFRDSMALAAASNIPQSLDEAGEFLDTEYKKDPIGKRLLQKLSKPQKDGTFNKDPELLSQLYDYCKQDVRTEISIVSKLRDLSEDEWRVWQLTAKINDKGVPVELKEIHNAINAVNIAQEVVDKEIKELTGGISASQPAKLIAFLNGRGLQLEDLTSETVDKLLSSSLTDDIAGRVLYLRKQGSQTAVAKYEKIKEITTIDGRIRNTLVYHGASTGRWASRGGLNLQNIARPTIDDEAIHNAIDRVLVNGLHGTMPELSSLVRSVIKAPDHHVFIDADFSSIENRVASWISHQHDKVDLFRQGLDEYKTFAAQMYKVSYDAVDKGQRQIAKSAVLGSMFGQGAKGLVDYAEKMGVKINIQEATSLVNTYRSSYAKVKAAWSGMEAAAISAVREPGVAFKYTKINFKYGKKALWMRLPSGRLICWQDPLIENGLTPWGDVREGITVRNQNTYTRKWGRNKLIGSSIFQSAVQGTARDFLAHAALTLDSLGFEVINLIHDEILMLAGEHEALQAEKTLLQVMSTPPSWAEDFPLAAETWVDKRYRK